MGLKEIFLKLSKLFGMFHLSRYLTRTGLRILCYHGFALEDESLFRPKLFISRTTFQRRLDFLRAQRYPVLTLEAALSRLDCGNLPDCATVITIDDGFYSVYESACELLNNFSFPATLYVTTYYCARENPVFRLVVQYMFWKTKKEQLDLSELLSPSPCKLSLGDPEEKDGAMWKVIRFGEEECDEQQRLTLTTRLGDLLGVNFEHIYQTRILSLVSTNELQSLLAQGIDIQLHTHRHCLPADEAHAIKEILDNKAVLEPLVGKRLQHFCYPSGLWSQELWPWLTAVGIKSALTCEPGLNYAQTPKLGLKRFLDGENITQVEFEAELAGYNELLRHAKSVLGRLWIGRKNLLQTVLAAALLVSSDIGLCITSMIPSFYLQKDIAAKVHLRSFCNTRLSKVFLDVSPRLFGQKSK